MTTVTLPLVCPNLLNERIHWAARAKRTKAHRSAVRLALGRMSAERNWLSLMGKVVVTLTRIAPRSLDPHDGLPASLKACTDGVADALGLKDNDPRIAFAYFAETGPAAVRVEVAMVDNRPAQEVCF